MSISSFEQSWSNVLQYIKRKLSTDISQLEIPDDEIIQHLKQTALITVSKALSYKYWYTLDSSKLVDEKTSTFKIDYNELPADTKVLKLYRVAYSNNPRGIYTLPNTPVGLDDLLLYAFEELDYLNSVKLFPELIGTNYITFNNQWSDISIYFPAKVELGIVYPSLDLMPPDLYYDYFLPLCEAEIKILLGERRASKFPQLSTPAGQIQLRAEELKQEGLMLKQQIEEKLNTIVDYEPLKFF